MYSRVTARGELDDAEAQALQRVAEQEVLLEAVASTPVEHQLLLQGLRVETDWPSEQRAQVLESNRLRVPKMDRPQRVEHRRASAAVADTLEVRVKIEGSRHGSLNFTSPTTDALMMSPNTCC